MIILALTARPDSDYTYTFKPAHEVTCIKWSLFLSYHRKFHMNVTSIKRSPVLRDHIFFVQGLTVHVLPGN